VEQSNQILDLVQLQVGRSHEFWCGSEVIADSDAEHLKGHRTFDFSFEFLVFEDLLEFDHGVLLLVTEFPPVGAQLTDIIAPLRFQGLLQLLNLVLDLDEVVEVEVVGFQFLLLHDEAVAALLAFLLRFLVERFEGRLEDFSH